MIEKIITPPSDDIDMSRFTSFYLIVMCIAGLVIVPINMMAGIAEANIVILIGLLLLADRFAYMMKRTDKYKDMDVTTT